MCPFYYNYYKYLLKFINLVLSLAPKNKIMYNKYMF